MKLNNKGFAITAVLYGLLIMFVLLVSSYLVVLSARKDRIDLLTEQIESEYNGNRGIVSDVLKDNGSFYSIPCSGKYIFNITESNNNLILECTVSDRLIAGDDVQYIDNALKISDNFINFDSIDCNEANNYIGSVNSITYDCN